MTNKGRETKEPRGDEYWRILNEDYMFVCFFKRMNAKSSNLCGTLWMCFSACLVYKYVLLPSVPLEEFCPNQRKKDISSLQHICVKKMILEAKQ